jgi:hypothetical protein
MHVHLVRKGDLVRTLNPIHHNGGELKLYIKPGTPGLVSVVGGRHAGHTVHVEFDNGRGGYTPPIPVNAEYLSPIV